jgi:SAM-dependent MidA family methyltransferase
MQQPASTALDPAAWTRAVLRDGQRVEVGDACRAWLQSWGAQWKRGAMLTIDYGDTFPEIYHRRPHGTVRAYALQQRLAGPEVYENMGRQDITADVNFTDLVAWGEELGWTTVQFTTQREFILQNLGGPGRRVQNRPADAFVLDEHGAGTAFKVLLQRRP